MSGLIYHQLTMTTHTCPLLLLHCKSRYCSMSQVRYHIVFCLVGCFWSGCVVAGTWSRAALSSCILGVQMYFHPIGSTLWMMMGCDTSSECRVSDTLAWLDYYAVQLRYNSGNLWGDLLMMRSILYHGGCQGRLSWSDWMVQRMLEESHHVIDWRRQQTATVRTKVTIIFSD